MAIDYFANRPIPKLFQSTPEAQKKADEPGMFGNLGRAAGSGALSAVGGIFDFAGADGIARQFYGWSDDARQSMSTEAQADMAKPFFKEDEQGDIALGEGFTDLDTWLLTLANVAGQAAPTMIPGAGIAGAATRALSLGKTGAKVAGAVGMGATGGAAATGQGMEQARQEYLAMPDEVKAQSDLFKSTLKRINSERPGLDPDSLWNATDEVIAAQLADDVRKDPATLLANFAGSAIADPIIGKALTGARLAKSGAFRSALKGFTIEGATEAGQAGVQEYGINKALAQVDERDPTEGVALAALNEGIAGGAFGGAAGFGGGLLNRQTTPKTKEDRDAEIDATVTDPEADAIRDRNEVLAQALDAGAKSAAKREADLRDITQVNYDIPAAARKAGAKNEAEAGKFGDLLLSPSQDALRDPQARTVADMVSDAASDKSPTPMDRFSPIAYQHEGELIRTEAQKPSGLLPGATYDGKLTDRALTTNPAALPDLRWEGDYLQAVRAEPVPQGITQKDIIFAEDGRPLQAAQEFAANAMNTARPALPQKDIIFAPDQSGVTVKLNGQPFQSKTEALASKQARLMKKAGQQFEVVPFADGWGLSQVATQKMDNQVEVQEVAAPPQESMLLRQENDEVLQANSTIEQSLSTNENTVTASTYDVAPVDDSPVGLSASGKPFPSERLMKASVSYKKAVAAYGELETVKVDGGFGFRPKAPVAQVDATPTQQFATSTEPAADLSGEQLNPEWIAFADDSGTKKIPRAEMPQIKAEHRGAMVNFMNARGVQHEQVELDPSELKPTQAEFSPAKVKKAMEFDGGDRSILVSSDGFVLDGHHQWLSKREKGEPIKAIRLDAPIDELVNMANEFPSSTNESGSTEQTPADVGVSVSDDVDSLVGSYAHSRHPEITAEVSKTAKGYEVDWGDGDVQEFKGSTAAQKLQAVLNRERYQKSQKTNSRDAIQPETSKPTETINDFGERLGGARKDVWTGFSEAINDDVNTEELPLSKSFPEPDYVKMAADGVSMETLAIIAAMRSEIPSKPRVSYKVRRWAEKVDVLRGFASDLISGDLTTDQVITAMSKQGGELRAIADAIPAITQANPETIKLAAKYRLGSGSFSMFRGKEYKPAKNFYFPKNGRTEMLSLASDVKQEALDNLAKLIKAEAAANPGTAGQKQSKISIYSDRYTKQVYLGWEGGKGVLRIQNFDSVSEAREYLKSNRADVESKLKQLKEIPNMRRPENRDRIGPPRYAGNITPAIFADTFGFRGVEFGNWVEQSKRQKDLNEAYDALMDLADVLSIPPKALALNGELGMAFGARGKGAATSIKAAAHYEPTYVAINLTKESGAGSLAHEWWHAVDNYFSRLAGSPGNFVTEGGHIRGGDLRPEVRDAFTSLIRAIRKTNVIQRASVLDSRRSKAYWSTEIEASARAFETFIISELEAKGFSNDYLANVVDQEAWDAFESDNQTYPYPTKDEQDVINPSFRALFDTLQIKETDKGTMLFSKSVVKKYEKSSHSRFNKEIDALLSGEVEEVNGALFHPEVGEIDIVWGNEGTEAKQYSDGFGLAKILKKHPEVNPYSLMDIVARARKTKAKGNTIELEDENTRLVLKLDWEGDDRKWLLTAFEPASRRKSIDTAPGTSSDVTLPEEEADDKSIAQNSSNEQDGTADNKKPEQVRHPDLISGSGSPSQVSDANVSADDGAVKENPDIKFQAANSDTKKPTKSIPPEQARRVVNSIVKQLNGAAGIKVVVLDSQRQAEKQWQMSLEDSVVRGAYDEQTKTAYVIAENIESLDQLREVVAHEVLAHGGLDTVIGKDKYKQFIERLQQTRSNKLFKTLWAQIDADYDGASAQEKAEELFAYYAQNKPVFGPLKFWWNALKRWLHKVLATVGLAKAGDPDIDAMDSMIESIRMGFMVDRVSERKAKPRTGNKRSELAFSKTATVDTRTAKEKLGLEDQVREAIVQQAKARTKATIDTLKSSPFWQRMNEGIFDGMAGIKQAEESVGITDPNQQGYVSARLASGLADVLHAVFNYGAPEWRDGVVSRKADTKGLLEVFGMLGDDLNNWLAWMGANRAEKLMAEGRENNLTPADIAELKALANGKERLFEQVRQEYNKINSAVITLAQEAGLISPEQRGGFDEEWYVPFFRDMDVDPEMEGIAAMVQEPTSRKGIANQSAKIKELKGGKQSTKDLMENIIQRQSTLIDAALKNKAMLEVVNNLDGTDYMQAIDSPDIAALSQAELSKIGRVRVMHNGKAKAYAVSDPALLRGLLQINDAGSKSLFNRMARSAKRFLTAGITLSPDFIIKNFVRDATHAWMINKDDFKFGADSIKGIKKAFKEDELYRDLIFSGAAFQGGYVHGADPEAAAQQIRRTLAAKGLGQGQIDSYLDSLVTKGSQLFEMYRTASDKFENANRLSTYEAALTKGKSKRQAAYEAKDLMDYSLKGNFALIGTMIDMLPFFNARLQGMSKLVRAARAGDGDRVLKVLSANLAMKGMKVAAFSLALAALNDDDERYQELPDWDKDGNWHFWLGDDHFRIPKPFELGILFGTLPERLFNYGTGNQPASDLGKSVAHSLFNTLALNPIPQIALPMVEVMTNRSFFKGSAIEGMADENKQAEDRYNAYTSDVAKLIGEAFGTSPKKIEHVIKGYTGTLGGYVLGIADGVARQIMGVESADTPISRYPVIKAFYQSDTPKTATKYQDEFYDALETATQAYGSYKRAVEEGDVVRQQELKEDEAKSLSSRVHLSRVQRQLSQLSKQAEMVNNNHALTGAQKRDRLEDITRKKNALYQGAYVRFKLGEW